MAKYQIIKEWDGGYIWKAYKLMQFGIPAEFVCSSRKNAEDCEEHLRKTINADPPEVVKELSI